ncbi:DUF192 domain-containing protein [Chlorogloeopsis sp. ULAP01]|jgi:uncharacterized protein|uniref:DUF192 domain-containing protein n=1 Tax=Chlorogloeopsis TaxID=1123 RepID=UPI0019FC7D31|nr:MULTISPECIES: DUF192 domain-containing protein [Chlorogloeopsis]MBF2004454.1 DUF192 domain-containing protein [Chlorogloeopsis fritschii C42_A2020_084]MDM9383555.1 DUF192 domain-containing protein [Chlorogloeopsis sp. ULAP01]
MEVTRQTTQTSTQTKGAQTSEKSLFLKILNIAGPIAGFTAALSPLPYYFWTRQPQYLPIGATFTSNNQTVQLELADDRKEYNHGLKFRNSIPNNHGMLFVLDKPEKVKLWMKDTYIPLDMIFLKDGKIKNIVRNTPPCKTEECPKYSSIHPVNQVIELPAGSADSLGLKIGKYIEINFNK